MLRLLLFSCAALAACSSNGPDVADGGAAFHGGTAPGEVSVSPRSVVLHAGDTFPFTVTAVDGQGQPLADPPVTFTVGDSAVATASGATVTAVAIGATQLLATDARGSWPLATVTVVPPTTQIDATTPHDLQVAPAVLLLPVNGTATLRAKVFSSAGSAISATVTFSASPSSVASVDARGVVTALAAGSAVITASVAGQNGALTQAIAVRVAAGGPLDGGTVETICQLFPERDPVCDFSATFPPWTALALYAGGTSFATPATVTLQCPLAVETTTDGIWTSSAPTIASVDASGTVTGLACGDAQISFTPNQPDAGGTPGSCSYPVRVGQDWRGDWTCTSSVPCQSTRSFTTITQEAAPFVEDTEEGPFVDTSGDQPPWAFLVQTWAEQDEPAGCGCLTQCCTSTDLKALYLSDAHVCSPSNPTIDLWPNSTCTRGGPACSAGQDGPDAGPATCEPCSHTGYSCSTPGGETQTIARSDLTDGGCDFAFQNTDPNLPPMTMSVQCSPLEVCAGPCTTNVTLDADGGFTVAPPNTTPLTCTPK